MHTFVSTRFGTRLLKPIAWLRNSSCRFKKKFTTVTALRNNVSDKTNSEQRGKELDVDDNVDNFKDMSVEELLEKSTTMAKPEAVDPEFPSDAEEYYSQFKNYAAWKRSQSKHAYRPKIDPKQTSILLFPGQGSQFVGMGKELLEYPNVLEMYGIASDVLGYNLLELCLSGPKNELDRTVHCQPALLVTSLAAVERLRHDHPTQIENCITAAGFSVGEIAALVFAGAFSFEDALKFVKVRAEAMQKASEKTASGMMVVYLSPQHKLRFACLAARQYCQERLNMERPVCEIANYLFPGCKVISGHEEALQFIEKLPGEFGIKRSRRLPVSGAFHSKLMLPARKQIKEELEKIVIEKPSIYIHSNVNTFKYKQTSVIRNMLVKQITEPVRWEQIMHIIYSRQAGQAFPTTYEVGPGKQLGTLLKMVNKKAHENYHKVEV